MKMRDLIAHAKHHGITVEEPDGTSHYRFTMDSFRTYPLSAHNGPKTEISDIYVKALCKHFAIPKPK